VNILSIIMTVFVVDVAILVNLLFVIIIYGHDDGLELIVSGSFGRILATGSIRTR
jgi:hypothetical protein